jgi:hypothetical protein
MQVLKYLERLFLLVLGISRLQGGESTVSEGCPTTWVGGADTGEPQTVEWLRWCFQKASPVNVDGRLLITSSKALSRAFSSVALPSPPPISGRAITCHQSTGHALPYSTKAVILHLQLAALARGKQRCPVETSDRRPRSAGRLQSR